MLIPPFDSGEYCLDYKRYVLSLSSIFESANRRLSLHAVTTYSFSMFAQEDFPPVAAYLLLLVKYGLPRRAETSAGRWLSYWTSSGSTPLPVTSKGKHHVCD